MLKRYIIGIITGIILTGVAVYAANILIDSKTVLYKETTVADALDDLIDRFETDFCSDGYDCIPKKYKLTYVIEDGGVLSEEETEVTFNSTYGNLATGEKSGYSLDGWYFDAAMTKKIDKNSKVRIKDNINVYGKWIVSLYNKVENSLTSSLKSADFDYTKPASSTNGPDGVYEYNGIADADGGHKKIYFYRGNVTNNNVIFAGYCWQIIRTTSTGGTKMIYNGTPDENGKCNSEIYYIGRSTFNDEYDKIYSAFYTYDKNDYLKTGTDSTIKNYIENIWYPTSNLNNKDYEAMMEDTPFCMDRRVVIDNELVSVNSYSQFGDSQIPLSGTFLDGRLDCQNEDILTLSNKRLAKKIGLINSYEVRLAGSKGHSGQSSYLVRNDKGFYLISPFVYNYNNSKASWPANLTPMSFSDPGNLGGPPSNGNAAVRPVISILNSVEVDDGDGSINNPYTLKS